VKAKATVAGAGLTLVVGLGGFLTVGGAAEQEAASAGRDCTLDVAQADLPGAPADTATVEQAKDRNVATWISVGKGMGVPADGIQIGIATTLVESGGLNLASKAVPESMRYPHDTNRVLYPPDGVPAGDHDSIGTAQQRVVHWTWWPSIEQGMKVDVQATAFYKRLLTLNWQSMSFGDAAQAVQGSAYPDRYALRRGEAIELYNRLSGSATPIGVDDTGCSDTTVPVGAVISGAWANPVKPAPYVIVSHWGPRSLTDLFGRNFHYGEDLAVPTGTPVHAACTGKTIGAGWVEGGGGNQVLLDCGGGITIKLMHNSKILTKLNAPVKAGEVVALSGSTGFSTAPHVHVQVEQDGEPMPPLPFFQARGVPL